MDTTEIKHLIPALDINIDAFFMLYKDYPNASELLRKALIEYTIATAPSETQTRLRGLQFQLDLQRRLSKSPLGASKRFSTKMFESLLALQEQFYELQEVVERFSLDLFTKTPREKTPKSIIANKNTATIMPFLSKKAPGSPKVPV
jgi:hypothetical protein